MDLSTAQRLADLNRRFYDEHAENFADARPRLAEGVRRVLARIPPGAHVLELGCGDGKVARALPEVAYVGVDGSAAMLDRARRYGERHRRDQSTGAPTAPRTADLPPGSAMPVPAQASYQFIQADLTSPAWPAALRPRRFDWVLAFAVLHHLPGYAAREAVVTAAAERLVPGGAFVMSNWQFTRSPRLLRRCRPWADLGLPETAVEPGDHLLAWERKGRRGLRYVHLLDAAEAQRLATAAGLTLAERFSADGVSGDLAEYWVMRK